MGIGFVRAISLAVCKGCIAATLVVGWEGALRVASTGARTVKPSPWGAVGRGGVGASEEAESDAAHGYRTFLQALIHKMSIKLYMRGGFCGRV